MKWTPSPPSPPIVGQVDVVMTRAKDIVGESSTTEEVSDPAMTTGSDRQAVVTFRAGLTLNLGNYEAARVDVGVEYPCDTDKIDAAYTRAKTWVSTRLQTEIAEIRQRRPGI